MRNKTAKRLRKLALKLKGGDSTLFKHPDGSIRWDGPVRKYKDLKKEWKESNILRGIFE